MPDIPPEAVQAAAAAIERELMSGKDYSMAQDSDEALARVALEAAAPLLADACAAAIIAHMNRPVPRRKRRAWLAYRRHFATAARVAARAFSTREDDMKAIAREITALHERHEPSAWGGSTRDHDTRG
jgi:hypothetical protein